ncbi:MAG: hypothetical protein ACJA1C_003392 [Crocinitomicaceae bacterium]|jgi:hypothetical protein
MIYRFVFIAFIGSISLFLISAGTSVTSSKAEAYKPTPPFSGGPGTGGLGDRTGSPLSSATCSQCHSGGAFNVSVTVDIFDPITSTFITSYVPGTTYEMTYQVTGNASAYGFQGGALTSANAAGGSFSSPFGAQLVTISGRPYIEHVGGPSATGTFQALWTAPASGSGDVTFYGIGLAVNQNGGTSGDNISTPLAVTITEEVPTTISYPGTPFCGNAANQNPTITGFTNGAFSSTAGLSIDGTSGVIDVSTSTPGTYSVDYVYSNGTVNTSITINPTFTSTSAATICDSETLTFGSQTLDASNAGLNTEIFQSIDGCDSTVDLTLTVLPSIVESDAATICSGGTYDFNGQTLTAANVGLNTVVLQTVNGCDSTVNLTLSVETIDITTGLTGGILNANQTGATYQWVDCNNGNAAIAGETNATYSPTAITGNYAVEITVNNCTETSACTLVDFTSLNELNINSSVVFPNPVLDVFEIKNIEQFGTVHSISLMDANGKVVQQISLNSTSTNIGHLDSGIYFLRIESASGDSIISIVKK